MLIILIAITVAASVTLMVVSMLTRPAATTIETRITDFRQRAVGYESDLVDLELPFADRVLRPSIDAISRAFGSILPASLLANVQQQLIMAGNPMSLNAFVTFWAVLLATFGGMGLMAFVLLPSEMMIQKLVAIPMLLMLGWMFPRMWLKGKMGARQKTVLKGLPDAMDLVTTCVEAGLGLDAALARVAEKTEGPFAAELQYMMRDVALGKLRREAMQELAQRIGVEELSTFIMSIVQAEQLGVGIAQVLRVQSDQLRTKRRQKAEKSAHEAPIKMLFPLVFFIFPAFLIVILGPAGIRIAESFGNQ
ncbi:MAG TPA: type II secretion system F family protein [Dehalococcoidia bacterium]|jgi:tight adherence protein C|nr:type II secretion system F family protein [Dehalococcoidia bacterium]